MTVNFTFSPGVRPTSEGSKKKSWVVTVISLTSGPGDGEVGVGVAAGGDVGVDVGVAVAVAAGRDVGVGVSEVPHAAASRPRVARRAIAKTRFNKFTPR